MEKEMRQVGLSNSNGLVCTHCGRPASFLCPLGALCPTDALIAAAHHDWIPVHIRDTNEHELSLEETPDTSTSA
jgi:hypothetical protein